MIWIKILDVVLAIFCVLSIIGIITDVRNKKLIAFITDLLNNNAELVKSNNNLRELTNSLSVITNSLLDKYNEKIEEFIKTLKKEGKI